MSRRRAMVLCLALAGLLLAGVGPGTARADQIRAASYAEPTTRYAHGVLGDKIEYGALEISLASGGRRLFRLPKELVFEDAAPRLADLDGDGAPEVIVVESHTARGARLAIWGPEGRITATPAIGRAFRWLAPLGAADLDGDGRTELAFVDRPHLARILRIWRYEDGQLTEIARAEGVTNHRIGWSRIPGGLRDCDGPEMILADAEWTEVLALRLTTGGRVSRRVLGPYTGPESLDAALVCGS
ncbi:Repeat domain-containing protein [Pseudooceanicola antarcticus]|uniref:Repeat domain-containing protein n=2 Tax=Pseudooceanicola antarcticus TaxID=1247613 RepID=A0A285ITS0_9RHOB|nr:VCBS repeat-containing protein [Pseudooceanicola antarcticus]SNY51382.1 Repeat domain-containing protein [Pseudooceanicola antarcticus]